MPPAVLRWEGTDCGSVEPVAPRILVGRGPAAQLMELRHKLGEGIFKMKQQYPETPPEGVQVRMVDGVIQ